jgi:hypothetical protein
MSFKRKFVFTVSLFTCFIAVSYASYNLGKNSVDQVVPQSVNLSVLLTGIPESEYQARTVTPTTPVATTSTTVRAATASANPTPTSFLRTTILTSNDALSGYRTSNGLGNTNTEVRVGRNSEAVSRGFITFELSLLPTGVNISEATLRLYQKEVVGRPYIAGGALKIDHLNYGNALDDPDYGMAALLSNFSIASTTARVGWIEVDVTDTVKDDIRNARPRSQFRLHFTAEQTGGTLEGDFTYFELIGKGQMAPYAPQLVVKY